MSPLPHQLGQLLLRRGAINEDQLQQALLLQQAEPQPLGRALIQLGFLDERTLARTLRQQRWLRPCAACFALVAPFSAAWASDATDESNPQQDWLENSGWYQTEDSDHIGQHNSSGDVVKFLAMTVWDIYQGSPEYGEVRFNLDQAGKQGYQLQMTMHF